jgi:glycosyltransferase involved in cell wall biosynthesis
MAPQCIKRLLAVTPQDYELLIVDCNTPKRILKQIEKAASPHPRVRFLRTDEYMTPNASKNWIISETAGSEWLALVENDNLVHPGWLEKLITACQEEEADVGRPMLMERRLGRTFPHFDINMGAIIDGPGGMKFEPYSEPLSSDLNAKRSIVTTFEVHVLVYRRAALDKTGPFDERLTTRQEIDRALQFYDAGLRVVFEPAALATFQSPPPVHRDDREFFEWRWQVAPAIRTHELIASKWNVEVPNSMGFVNERLNLVSLRRYTLYLLRRYGISKLIRNSFRTRILGKTALGSDE